MSGKWAARVVLLTAWVFAAVGLLGPQASLFAAIMFGYAIIVGVILAALGMFE